MSSDLTLLLDDVRNDLEFLSKCWKLGRVKDVPVRMERLQTLIPSACLEHLDFLDEDSSNLEFLTLRKLETDNSQSYI